MGATMSTALKILFALAAAMMLACGPSDTASSADALSSGEYVSRATTVANGGYIGDWEHEWGYVLGYLGPGAKIYAHTVREGSVYGLIVGSGYGAWDHGHHCGWVSLKHLKGYGFHSSAADICPPPDNDFSLASGSGGPTGFRHGSWVTCNGCVQRAVVLPTCSDFTVYANYDPVTHTFADPDGTEVAGRGTIDGSGAFSVPEITVTQGYSGFGTRFVDTDSFAVEIKDTKRQCTIPGGCTAFGFMHADCIAGEKVGDPASHPTPVPPLPTVCGNAARGEGLRVGQSFSSCSGRYVLSLQTDGNVVLRDQAEGGNAIWATGTSHTDAYVAVFQEDGNLVVYDSHSNPLWASHTNDQGAVRLALQPDGNLVLYNSMGRALWSTGTAGQ